ncbi:hypothetical protein CS0771_65300 [Catellatospora sp. IY07-71]|uniref:DUF5709 domain-containing protein n=1 Tax=Catellatospora sp. IY07-71 TaxID=2728827 RepID=UPI001BB31378|nr:DUF5709 domain-containing protein [Catellatospora sp. IY07-71]BCJ76986.1 hypothetical protein CS0771_65300 [Catellatospora sp. IY07-71]
MARQDSYPHPVSDTEADGIPEYADQDSNAYDEVESVREADGRDPAPLPADREAGPLAVDEFSTTAGDGTDGEPLATRLAREEPDVLEEIDDGAPLRPADGSDTVEDEQPSFDRQLHDEAPVDPHLDSQVSMYERMGEDPLTGGLVGRLVAPDEGLESDTEGEAVAYDAGAAGGGASAEELAMHEVPLDEDGSVTGS